MPFDGTKSAPLATAMMNLFGPNGEHWGQGSGYNQRTGKFCLVGAMRRAHLEGTGPGTISASVHVNRLLARALLRAYPDWIVAITAWSITAWNDAPERTFAEVRKVVETLAELEMTQDAMQ